ncbi:Uncharacterized protein dnm_087950 [Desulfonema magnum]|uniref:Uncharacterized protein n=1 Tax=Desulfonema magnum TaxID=45655 RepID=A0A975BVV4_9BACT|nr:Uncharacterized protein dnm_087950 [Desulfonema magnum]
MLLTWVIPNGSEVQKLYFCACEKAFFALRRCYKHVAPYRALPAIP